MVDLKEYLPSVYKDVQEMEAIIFAENELLSEAEENAEKVFNNTFIVTADEDGILRFERLLGIIPDPSLGLEFRRERVLARLSMTPVFPIGFIRQRLDEILGAGAYSLGVDYQNYNIELKSVASNQLWFEEVRTLINWIKPANMSFVNIPEMYDFLPFSEEIHISQEIPEAKYILGQWELGKTPFFTEYTEYIGKGFDTSSLTTGIESFPALNNFMYEAVIAFAEVVKGVVLKGGPKTVYLQNKEGYQVIISVEGKVSYIVDIPAGTFPQGIDKLQLVGENESEILYEYNSFIPNTENTSPGITLTAREVLFQ